MATLGRFEVKGFLLVALALFCCLANGEIWHQTHLDGTKGAVAGIDGNITLNYRRLLSHDRKKKKGDDGGNDSGKDSSGGQASSSDTQTAPGGPLVSGPSGTVGADGVFDITKFGAKPDGSSDSTVAFMNAWKAACGASAAQAQLLVPKGSFLTGPVVFRGPCKSSKPIVFSNQGTILASTDLSAYVDKTWLMFQAIDGLIINGGGTFNGQGASAWPYNDCKKNKDCVDLPSSIKFQRVSNSVVTGVTSLNPKYFHFHITDCTNFKADNLKITAPGESPNTDGIHFSDTSGITVTKSTIGTGDDCISIGGGVTDATFTGLTCGPGHGLSVGSLGKYQGEKPVKGITFSSCTVTGTTNGARIKTYGTSPPGSASEITFSDITMNNVENPIIIDQKYGKPGESKLKVSNVHFTNIKGTSKSPVSILLDCSAVAPCEAIELSGISLTGTATCNNAKTTGAGGKPACK